MIIIDLSRYGGNFQAQATLATGSELITDTKRLAESLKEYEKLLIAHQKQIAKQSKNPLERQFLERVQTAELQQSKNDITAATQILIAQTPHKPLDLKYGQEYLDESSLLKNHLESLGIE